MWRFLHNIPRALKNYHAPRATVGVIVENDDKEQVTEIHQDNDKQGCKNVLLPTPHLNSYHVLSHDPHARVWSFFQGLLAQRNTSCNVGQSGDFEADDKNGWNGFQSYMLPFLADTNNQMLEALAKGSWKLDLNKKSSKSDLLYSFLYSLCVTCNKDGISLSLNVKNRDPRPEEFSEVKGQTILAIKDEQGSEQDRQINETKSETLDAALREFEQICEDYTSQNESLLALLAADKGEMSEAVQHFCTACSMGNKSACFNLGLCYEMGTGVKKDLPRAKHYYGLAASKGHYQAMYNLSLLYLNGEGEGENKCEEGFQRGIELMEQAAKAGLPQAQTHMGLYYMQGGEDARKGAAYFKAAADQHDSEAQYFLAVCHEHGQGVEVNECWAAHLYSMAANNGNDSAIFSLARFHENGLGGIPIDLSTACELYSKAASLGNKEAQIRLTELSAIQKRMEQRLHEEEIKQPDLIPVKMKSSHSTPNLNGKPNTTVSKFLYQKLYELLYHSDPNEKTMFDPGGENKRRGFYIGVDNEDHVTVVEGAMSKHTFLENSGYNFCQSKHKDPVMSKSRTSPDLNLLVACNI